MCTFDILEIVCPGTLTDISVTYIPSTVILSFRTYVYSIWREARTAFKNQHDVIFLFTNVQRNLIPSAKTSFMLNSAKRITYHANKC